MTLLDVPVTPDYLWPDQPNPTDWLGKLSKKLDERDDSLRTLDAYYNGDHPLAFASDRFREAFGGLFHTFADNWCDLVVDAVEERLNVEGFRYGTDPTGDKKAWNIWQANNLDAESQIAHTEALKLGSCNVLVWAGDDPKTPQVTVEHPRESIVACAAENRRKRLAALKRWVDDDGFGYAFVYLPEAIYKFRSVARLTSQHPSWYGVKWSEWAPPREDWPLRNPFGVVPMVPLVNRPSLMDRHGRSELATVIPVQNAVNKMVADMLVASEYAAFRQRWATGYEIPEDPDTGRPIEQFRAAVSRLWVSDDENTKFGDFAETNLANFVNAIEMLVQHISSQTRTPPHYFFLRGQFPSGESIKSAESGLVKKARRKMRHFGETWEEVMRLSFLVVGDKRRSQVTNAETIWGDPETRIESAHVDAVIKKLAAGVPRQQIWEELDYSPQQIDRFEQMLQALPEVPPNQAGATPGQGAGGTPMVTPDGPGPAVLQPPAIAERPIRI
jgi:hypothetical protein